MKNKIFLRIRQRGVLFRLSGREFRSPVDIDITQYKIDPILCQMKTNGITDYEIFTEETSKVKASNSKIIVVDSKIDEIERLNLKVGKLENLVAQLIEQNKEKNREQNNKDDISQPESIENKLVEVEKIEPELEIKPKKISNKIERIKKKIKKHNERIINNKTFQVINKSVSNAVAITNNNNNENLDNKKIIIEELELVDDVNIKLEEKITFKPNDFRQPEIEKPFKISSDVEMLKKFKKE